MLQKKYDISLFKLESHYSPPLKRRKWSYDMHGCHIGLPRYRLWSILYFVDSWHAFLTFKCCVTHQSTETRSQVADRTSASWRGVLLFPQWHPPPLLPQQHLTFIVTSQSRRVNTCGKERGRRTEEEINPFLNLKLMMIAAHKWHHSWSQTGI